MNITEGMRVQRVDFECDGSAHYFGIIERITDNAYWIKWDNATTVEPHERGAFAPIPPLPNGWTVIQSAATSQGSVSQLLRSGGTWATRWTTRGDDEHWNFTASEEDAREDYASIIEAS